MENSSIISNTISNIKNLVPVFINWDFFNSTAVLFLIMTNFWLGNREKDVGGGWGEGGGEEGEIIDLF